MAYLGNQLLRPANEEIEYTQELVDEFVKCKEDILYFAEKYFKIITVDKGESLIELWGFQKKILKAMIDPSPKRNVCILSARQSGKTTLSTVYALHYVLFNKDKRVAILANKEKTAIEILERIQLAYQYLPYWMQPGIQDGGWSKKNISLGNGSKIIASSTASSGIRGLTINLLLLDEFAHILDSIADDFMRSVYPTITSGKTSKVIIMSTPNGLNKFYDIWKKAIRDENDYKPIKIRWDDVPGRDITFKKNYIDNNSIMDWRQEYECVFLGSSATLIDPELLERIDTKDPIDMKYGSLFNIYEAPKDDKLYIMGVDSAKGTGNDYSVIQVLKINNEHDVEQVAVYRNNMINTYDFAQICIEISKYYNGCYMLIENNDCGGETCQLIWYDFEYDMIINTDKKGIGTRATRTSKLAANLFLKRYMERGWLELHDKRTVYELSRYEEISPNVFRAGRRDNDDCVMSLVWGLYFLSTDYYDGKDVGVRQIDDKYKLEDDQPMPIIVDEIYPH